MRNGEGRPVEVPLANRRRHRRPEDSRDLLATMDEQQVSQAHSALRKAEVAGKIAIKQ